MLIFFLFSIYETSDVLISIATMSRWCPQTLKTPKFFRNAEQTDNKEESKIRHTLTSTCGCMNLRFRCVTYSVWAMHKKLIFDILTSRWNGKVINGRWKSCCHTKIVFVCSFVTNFVMKIWSTMIYSRNRLKIVNMSVFTEMQRTYITLFQNNKSTWKRAYLTERSQIIWWSVINAKLYLREYVIKVYAVMIL